MVNMVNTAVNNNIYAGRKSGSKYNQSQDFQQKEVLEVPDGVHVGQDDMEAGEVRKRLGEDKIIGVSAHSVEEALRAEKCGATYLGSGAVFGSGTKKDVGTLDHEVLKEICAAVQIPVVAIGGISRDNILQLKGTGIDGVAVISAIFAQKDIRAAAQELRKLSEEVCR